MTLHVQPLAESMLRLKFFLSLVGNFETDVEAGGAEKSGLIQSAGNIPTH